MERPIKTLKNEYKKALKKHPLFPWRASAALCIVTEEVGELAKEINDKTERERREKGKKDLYWKERAYIEAAHVAVTAFRIMEGLYNSFPKEEK